MPARFFAAHEPPFLGCTNPPVNRVKRLLIRHSVEIIRSLDQVRDLRFAHTLYATPPLTGTQPVRSARGRTPNPLMRFPRSQFGNPLVDKPASFLARYKPARFRIANPPVNRVKRLLVFGLRIPRLAHKNYATPPVADKQPLRPAIPADSPVQTQWAQPGKERRKRKHYNESPEYFATHNGINSRIVASGTTSPRREARIPRSIAASVSRSSSAKRSSPAPKRSLESTAATQP